MTEQSNIEIWEYTILSHFLPALINGDVSGLTDEEQQQLIEFEKEAKERAEKAGYPKGHTWQVTGCNEFARCEITGLMGDVSDLTFVAWREV